MTEIRDKELFKSNWYSFSDYVEDMKMSEASASKIINIYKKFIVEYGIEPQVVIDAGGWSQVAEILPVVTTKEDAEEWLDKSKHLTRKDLRIEMMEKKKGVVQYTCQHKDTYTIRVCRDCGAKFKIDDNS